MPDSPLNPILGHLDRLVGFNTVSDQPNRGLTDYIGEVLAPLGFEIRLDSDPTGGKTNLIARLGPDGPNGLMLA
ncbi:MAG: acetylornithine deacetylase, partial [Rhodospirillales bacterium]|nr:acetylornithine deacetylase [Rhodospirillales bacterium]